MRGRWEKGCKIQRERRGKGNCLKREIFETPGMHIHSTHGLLSRWKVDVWGPWSFTAARPYSPSNNKSTHPSRMLAEWLVHTLRRREPKNNIHVSFTIWEQQEPLWSRRWRQENNSRDSGPLRTEHAQSDWKHASGKQRASWKALREVTQWREGWPPVLPPCLTVLERREPDRNWIGARVAETKRAAGPWRLLQALGRASGTAATCPLWPWEWLAWTWRGEGWSDP